MSHSGERRTNHALRRRIDKLLGRVQAAREEIVEKGLDAVHEDPARRDSPKDERAPDTGPADARA